MIVSSMVLMSINNTVLHRQTFEGLVDKARARGEAQEVVWAILYAALAVARAELGSNRVRAEAIKFLMS